MTKKRRFRIPAPAIGIAVLVVSAIIAERWLIQGKPTSLARTPVAVEAPEETAQPVQEPAQAAVLLADLGPRITPATDTWSTYHGGTQLTGLAKAEIPETPEVLWRHQIDGEIYTTPVADGNGIYFSTYKSGVYALDLDGNERWHREILKPPGPDGVALPERIDAPVACFRSRVLVGTLSGKVHALDAETGEPVWMHDIEGTVLGAPNLHSPKDESVPPTVVLLRQDDGRLFGLDLETGAQRWTTDGPERCDGSPSLAEGKVVFGSCAAALHIFSAGDGSLIRDIPLDADSQVAGGVAFAGTSLFTGSHSGHFFHAHAESGQIVWVNKDSQDEIFTTPAVDEDVVIFGSDEGSVYALDRGDGTVRWKFEGSGTPTSPVIAGDKVVVGLDGVLFLLALDSGAELWSYEISDAIASPALIGNRIVVGSEDGTVTAFGNKEAQP